MAKFHVQKSRRSAKPGAAKDGKKTRGGKKRTIAQINAWMDANHDQLLQAAKENCIRLTGRPTFGAPSRRKSA